MCILVEQKTRQNKKQLENVKEQMMNYATFLKRYIYIQLTVQFIYLLSVNVLHIPNLKENKESYANTTKCIK